MNCVVVPIYKEFLALSANEIISIKQLYKILYKHTIYAKTIHLHFQARWIKGSKNW